MVSLMKLRRKLEQMTTRRKIFFTVVILMLIQVAAHIPVLIQRICNRCLIRVMAHWEC